MARRTQSVCATGKPTAPDVRSAKNFVRDAFAAIQCRVFQKKALVELRRLLQRSVGRESRPSHSAPPTRALQPPGLGKPGAMVDSRAQRNLDAALYRKRSQSNADETESDSGKVDTVRPRDCNGGEHRGGGCRAFHVPETAIRVVSRLEGKRFSIVFGKESWDDAKMCF